MADLSFPLVGPGGEPVDLARTIDSHGFGDLPPMRHVDGALEFTLPLPGRRARTARIHAGGRVAYLSFVDGVRVDALAEVCAPGTMVIAGQFLGVVGRGGHCDMRCLHIGLRVGGVYLPPSIPRDEVLQVMDDLRSADVDFLTIGQYLQPTLKHAAVARFVPPDEFESYKTMALARGFLLVSSSPLTRSSYHADADFARLQGARAARLGRG